eukprot:TRINITY_DN19631_c0_g1_i1.p1 TRINITY_DN19631_c0_g1~~TRINITY_DN19631_c0_g1_i1.p1  ORF type:complete len:515 (+),score=42.16 TRINITY_DN19631_c0_g1_i1:59-1603(+)
MCISLPRFTVCVFLLCGAHAYRRRHGRLLLEEGAPHQGHEEASPVSQADAVLHRSVSNPPLHNVSALNHSARKRHTYAHSANLGFASWSISSFLASVASVPTLIIFGAVCFCAAFVRPSSATTSSGIKDGVLSSMSPEVRWLRTLAATTVGLLVVQLIMGALAHSLTLLADSAHTAADAAMYLFGFVAEWKKGTRKSNEDKVFVAWIDVLSMVLTFIAIVFPSMYAMWRGVLRFGLFSMSGTRDYTGDSSDSLLMGGVLVAFSTISTISNAVLMLMYSRGGFASSASELTVDKAQGGLSVAKETSTHFHPPPAPSVPLATPAPEASHQEASPAGGNTSVLLQPPPSPPPPRLPYTSRLQGVPPPPSAFSLPTSSSLSRYARRKRGALQSLHMMFHPACTLENCPIDDPSAGRKEDAASATRAKGVQEANIDVEEGVNLNLHGALLHLITDIVRSIVILVTGGLVLSGKVRDSVKADAACAIVVGSCVIIGALAMTRGLRQHVSCLWEAYASSSK